MIRICIHLNQVRASDNTVRDGLKTDDLHVDFVRDGHFELNYDIGNNAPTVVLHTSAGIKSKTLRMKYRHELRGKKRSSVEGKMAVDDKNTATLTVDTTDYSGPDLRACTLKWNHQLNDYTKLEAAWNFNNDTLRASVDHRVDSHNRLKIAYGTGDKNGSLEWTNKDLGGGGELKVLASTTLTGEGVKRMPTLTAEKTWNVEI